MGARTGAGAPMTNITRPPTAAWPRSQQPGQRSLRAAHVARITPAGPLLVGADPYLSGRTTPRIFIEPAPASVTLRPGRGEWTIAPSPTYIPTWLASAW